MAPPRLAILNGFGRSLGDSLIGLQALHTAQAIGGLPVPCLVRRRYGRKLADQLYDLADFAEVRIIPDAVADDAPPGFDQVIDMRDFAFDPAFAGVSMIDFFLARLGLDPAVVPATQKRNVWLAPRVRPTRPAGLPDRYVLVCPKSSMALRDMPEDVHRLLLARLGAITSVVTQGAGCAGAVPIGELDDLASLCGLVANAEAIISTDTAMVHLADAFGVKTLAVFTTHRPDWRVRDYPLCRALHLPVDGLPDSLEFSRGDADLRAAKAAWRDNAARITDAASNLLAS